MNKICVEIDNHTRLACKVDCRRSQSGILAIAGTIGITVEDGKAALSSWSSVPIVARVIKAPNLTVADVIVIYPPCWQRATFKALTQSSTEGL